MSDVWKATSPGVLFILAEASGVDTRKILAAEVVLRWFAMYATIHVKVYYVYELLKDMI